MDVLKNTWRKKREHAKTSGRKSSKNDSKKFLGKLLLSIDIGQYTTKLVWGRTIKPAVVEVKRILSFPTPAGSVEKGRIVNIDALARQIDSIVKVEKTKAAFVFCTMENAEIITREILLPTAAENDMEDMLEYEVQQYMPVDLGNYIIQSKMLDTFSQSDISKTRFLSTAVPKDLVQSYYELMQKVNLKASVLDIQSNAIDKLVQSELVAAPESVFPAEASIAVVDIGYSHINAVLMENGQYQFNRYIDQGAVNIDRSLMSVFDYTEGEVSEKKRNTIDLNSVASILPDASDSLDQITMREINVVKNIVDNWSDELERVFRYYASRRTNKTVQKIYIHGGAAQIKGIEDYLSKVLGIPVQRINTLNCVRTQDNTEVTPYLNAIGVFFRR